MYNPYENIPEKKEESLDSEPINVTENESPAEPSGYSRNYAYQETHPQEEKSDQTYETANHYHNESSYQSENVNPYQYQQPPQHYSGYRPPQPPPNQGHYPPPYQASYTWGNQPPQQPQKPPKPPKAPKPPKTPKPPMSKGERIIFTIIACVLSCVIASTGSLGIFSYLITSGYFTITAQSEDDGYVITQTKIVDETSGSDEETVSGSLTSQEISEMVLPSVVCISNYQVTSSIDSFGTTYGLETDELSPTSEGSGIICSEDGYIVTNNHVIDGATSLKVTLYDGSVYEAELIGSDSLTDLAVIKIEAEGLTAADFGVSSDLTVADTVLAIGNPGGMEFSSSVTAGIVSALERGITSDDGYTMYYIQTDAAISPGNSGGALVNEYGQVIGINSAKIVDTSYEGLGFAIPSDTFLPIVEDLIENGEVTNRAVLGISYQYVDSMTARFYGLVEGVYVGEVTSDLAVEAGLLEGDIITSFNGEEITSESQITGMIASMSPGDIVTLIIYRSTTGEDGIELQVELTS